MLFNNLVSQSGGGYGNNSANRCSGQYKELYFPT
nr:MAG TPA: hypothetical protein [Caudoviricetes sp.]